MAQPQPLKLTADEAELLTEDPGFECRTEHLDGFQVFTAIYDPEVDPEREIVSGDDDIIFPGDEGWGYFIIRKNGRVLYHEEKLGYYCGPRAALGPDAYAPRRQRVLEYLGLIEAELDKPEPNQAALNELHQKLLERLNGNG